MLALLITEAPWKSRMINVQHFLNEVAFYAMLLQMAVVSGLCTHNLRLGVETTIGWSIIGLTLLAVVCNAVLILSSTIKDLRFHLRRRHARKRARKAYLARLKVAPREEHYPED